MTLSWSIHRTCVYCVQRGSGLLLSFRMIEQQRQVHSLECLANIQLTCKQCALCYNGICMLQLHKMYAIHVMCLLNEDKFLRRTEVLRLIWANWLLPIVHCHCYIVVPKSVNNNYYYAHVLTTLYTYVYYMHFFSSIYVYPWKFAWNIN